MASSKQVRNRWLFKMASGWDSPGRHERPLLSDVDLRNTLFQSWLHQQPPPYPEWTERRSMYLPDTEQSHVKGVKNVSAAAFFHKRTKKNDGIPHNGDVATASAKKTKEELCKKQKPRSRGPTHQRRSELRLQEYRKKFASKQLSDVNDGQDTLTLKETRNSSTQTECTTVAIYEDPTGPEVLKETNGVSSDLEDDCRLTRLEKIKLLIPTLSHIVRYLYHREDIRWPHPDAVTRYILTSNNLPESDLPALKAIVEKVFETRNEELNWGQLSEAFAHAYGLADCGPFVKHCTITFSYMMHYIFIIVILIIVIVVYLQPNAL